MAVRNEVVAVPRVGRRYLGDPIIPGAVSTQGKPTIANRALRSFSRVWALAQSAQGHGSLHHILRLRGKVGRKQKIGFSHLDQSVVLIDNGSACRATIAKIERH